MTRIFVPTTPTGLRELVRGAGIGPAPVRAHAVTEALRKAWPDASEEEWEYAASAAAARASIGLLRPHDPPRRVVVALDADQVAPVADEDPTVVEAPQVIALRRVASVLADDATAEHDVAAASSAWTPAEQGDAEARHAVERCLDRDLGWYATQELVDLLGDLGVTGSP